MRRTKILKASTLGHKIRRLKKHLNKKVKGRFVHSGHQDARDELTRLERI